MQILFIGYFDTDLFVLQKKLAENFRYRFFKNLMRSVVNTKIES